MVSKLAQVKSVVLDLLSDGKEHSSEEMRNRISEEGLELVEKAVH